MSQPPNVSAENPPAVDDCHEEAGKRYRASSLLVLLAIGLFVLLVTRRAWLSDDGFITFRTVHNFVNGYGLTWNVAERVQAYTHPLWMFTLSIASFITRELPLTCLAVSIVMAPAAVILLGIRVAVSETAAALGILALALSPSFVDYSTSGLENPLSYLLLVIFFALYFGQGDGHKKLFLLSLVASFAITNRLDLSLLLLPALAYSFWQLRDWKALFMVVLGQVPFLLWEVFSILYYGFPFPNTVYAKMNTGISAAAYARQGLVYLLDSLNANPMTLLLIIVSLALVVLQGDWRQRAVAGGIILYLIYVVRIGGDFMSERFLTIPYLCAVIILVRYDFSRLASHAVVVIFLLVLTLSQFAGEPGVSLCRDAGYPGGRQSHRHRR